MNDEFSGLSDQATSTRQRLAESVGSSTLLRLLDAMINLGERNKAEHKLFASELRAARDAVKDNYNSFAGDMQKAFQQMRKEFHGEKRAATQAWFEAKEMEKERKRLAAEEKEQAAKKAEPAKPRAEKEFRERPVRKGKKPFVPPTGRNAGKPLGGNFIGRIRAEKEQRRSTAESADIDVSEPSPRASHPLGDAAKSDE